MAEGKKPAKTLLILGKAGNGKSSTANTILGLSSFDVAHSFKSNNHECQTEENNGIRVVCAPDLQQKRFYNKESDKEKKKGSNEIKSVSDIEVNSWLSQSESKPDAIVLVIRCDKRFTPQEYEAYKELKEHPSLKKLMEDKLVIVFTVGDRLNGRDMRLLLEPEHPALKIMQEIWNDAKKRYVVFDNTADGPRRNVQVKALMEVVRTMEPHPLPQHTCRLLFSAPKNELVKIQRNLGVTGRISRAFKLFDHFELNGLQLELTFYCTDESDQKAQERVKTAVSPGPHAIFVSPDDLLALQQLFGSDVGPFCLDKRFNERSELIGWLDELAFPTKGEFFQNEDLRKIAEAIYNETMTKTEIYMKSSTFDTYLSVKKAMID